NNQDSRITANICEIHRTIVLRQRILLSFDLNVVAIKAGCIERLGEGKQIFARRKFNFRGVQILIVTIKADSSSLCLVGLSKNLYIECLAFLQIVRKAEFLDGDVMAANRADWNYIHSDP